MADKIMCTCCSYLKRYGNCAECEHPDQKYIVEFFHEHHISRAIGFIGFYKFGREFPIKSSPKWCPRKKV